MANQILIRIFATINIIIRHMHKDSFFYKVFDLYYDGFRNMTLGRTLWAIIFIKLFIMFAVLKVFFFPNFIKEHSEKGQEAEFVATELFERGT